MNDVYKEITNCFINEVKTYDETNQEEKAKNHFRFNLSVLRQCVSEVKSLQKQRIKLLEYHKGAGAFNKDESFKLMKEFYKKGFITKEEFEKYKKYNDEINSQLKILKSAL